MAQRNMNNAYAAQVQETETDLLDSVPLKDALHRAKDLVPGNDHVVCHIAEDSGLQVVSVGTVLDLATTLKLGTILLALLNVAQDDVQLLLADLRHHDDESANANDLESYRASRLCSGQNTAANTSTEHLLDTKHCSC